MSSPIWTASRHRAGNLGARHADCGPVLVTDNLGARYTDCGSVLVTDNLEPTSTNAPSKLVCYCVGLTDNKSVNSLAQAVLPVHVT